MTTLSQRLARYREDASISFDQLKFERDLMHADIQTLHSLLVEAREALNGAEKVMGDLKGNVNEYWNIRGALTRINAVLEKE